MATIFLTHCTADDRPQDSDPTRESAAYQHLLRSARSDVVRRHRLVQDPAQADLILFAESHHRDAASGPYFGRIRSHPLYRQFRNKCFVHSGQDHIIPTVPGIFPSLEAHHAGLGRARSGPYLGVTSPYESAEPLPFPKQPKHLASFVGVVGRKALRHRMCSEIKHPDILVRDTTQAFIGSLRRGDGLVHQQLKDDYVQTTRESRFVLCPRGTGASSIRLFEVMQMGRAPVVISDAWVPPSGPDWNQCIVRIPETKLHETADRLQQRAAEANVMGTRARRAWERYFSEDRLFDTIAQNCKDLRASAPQTSTIELTRTWGQFLRSPHPRLAASRLKQRLRLA